MTQRFVSYDCRFFQGDRPCIWHKREKVICKCDHHRAVGKRLLVIKLVAVGDVL